ncbi:MAG: hypothetical protein ACRDNF_01610, partial [Streptosporangiaceae bacterium]
MMAAAAVVGALAGGGGAARAAMTRAGVPGLAAGDITTVAGGFGGPGQGRDIALASVCGVGAGAGRVVLADQDDDTAKDPVRALNPRTGWMNNLPATVTGAVSTCSPAVDHAGNVVLADPLDSRVKVVAKRTGTFYGRPMTKGQLYPVAGTGVAGFSGDCGPATAARLDRPYAVAVDRAGNLLIDDQFNERIRVVAERDGWFYGQQMTAGNIYTVAGNGKFGHYGEGILATRARLSEPFGVAADPAGNLVIAGFIGRIRVVAVRAGVFYGQAMRAGHIYTVAGGGTSGLGDGGPATDAELSIPQGVAADAASNLLIADTGDNRVRVVAASTGTFYGQAMTAGDIYPVAGGGTGSLGDGGPATSAEINGPGGV